MPLRPGLFWKWYRRRQEYGAPYFGSDAVIWDEDCRLQAIRPLPERFAGGAEVPFWLGTGQDVYLLTLRDGQERRVAVCPSDQPPYHGVCVTVVLPLAGRRWDETLKEELRALLKQAGCPPFPRQPFLWQPPPRSENAAAEEGSRP